MRKQHMPSPRLVDSRAARRNVPRPLKSIHAFSLVQKSISSISQLCIAASISVLGFSTIVGAAWQPALSEQDIANVSSVAKSLHPTVNQFRQKSDSNYSLGLEVLMVELQEKKSRQRHDARVAEVFTYNYNTNNAQLLLIDVNTHKLLSTHSIENIHLPLNQREIELANSLLLKNAQTISELEQEYLTQFGTHLKSFSDLEMKVSIWDPGPNHMNTICSKTRCALVSVFSHDHYNF